MIKYKKKIKDFLNEYNIRPKKKLGQNFIFDENILNKITKCIGPMDKLNIIEIGPGPGGLTRSLLEQNPKSIILIEKDLSFKNILSELTTNYPEVFTTLIFNDFLKVNLDNSEIFKKENIKFISNLPYYISTQVLLKILPLQSNVLEAIFMFQKEVAERLIAKPNNKQYSKLSVIAQYCCSIKKLFPLKSSIFYPKPEVDSCLLSFKKKNNIRNDVFDELQKLTKLAFEKRRKTIKNSLSKIEGINELLNELEIDSKCRAENLSVENFTSLAENLVTRS